MIRPLVDRIGLREEKTVDIVERLGVISPKRVHLRNYPVDNPTTVFNPAMLVSGGVVEVYPRVVMGYFSYASAIAKIEIAVEDLLGRGVVSVSHYPADIVLYPDCRYDLWGTEDPRISTVGDRVLMTYCGRTISYFNPMIRIERTLPVTAVLDREKGVWRKSCTFRMPKGIREFVVSDKDAFVVEEGGELLLFHRPHMRDEKEYYVLALSKIRRDALEGEGVREVIAEESMEVLYPEPFESKLGWCAPPIRIGDESLLLVHAVDREELVYRVFAVLMKLEGEPRVTAITPHYIMEPKMSYEIYGDRPYTVFPCGAQVVDEKLVVSYGAGDLMTGFGCIDLSVLLSILDKNRLE